MERFAVLAQRWTRGHRTARAGANSANTRQREHANSAKILRDAVSTVNVYEERGKTSDEISTIKPHREIGNTRSPPRGEFELLRVLRARSRTWSACTARRISDGCPITATASR